MAIAKPQYSSKTAITISLNSLANNSVAISNAINNSSNLYEDFLIEVVIAGTAGSNAFCEVRLLASEDGTNFGTWESGIPLGTIDLSVSPQTGHFSVVNSLFKAPQYFKIAVKNNTGNALSSSGNSASYQGINTQIV
jgi:hypothetical protein